VELAHGGEGVEDGEGWSIVAKTQVDSLSRSGVMNLVMN
jgi:hypothetical protein